MKDKNMTGHPLPPDDMTALGRPVWGLPNIARVLGISVDTARRWAKLPGVPIYRPAEQGSYVAFKGELREWLRSARSATGRNRERLAASAKSCR